MMRCSNVEKELAAYYYGELDESIRSEISAHLDSCKRCASSWEAIEKTLNAVEFKEPEMPEAFWKRYTNKVYARIEKRRSHSPFSIFRPRLLPVAAAVLILLLAVFGGLKLYESKQEESFISKNYEMVGSLELYQNLELMQYLEEIEAIQKR